jgi:hypothetical protein
MSAQALCCPTSKFSGGENDGIYSREVGRMKGFIGKKAQRMKAERCEE